MLSTDVVYRCCLQMAVCRPRVGSPVSHGATALPEQDRHYGSLDQNNWPHGCGETMGEGYRNPEDDPGRSNRVKPSAC